MPLAGEWYFVCEDQHTPALPNTGPDVVKPVCLRPGILQILRGWSTENHLRGAALEASRICSTQTTRTLLYMASMSFGRNAEASEG